MPTFKLGQTTLRISKEHLSRSLAQKLRRGQYEKQEAKALELHLSVGDRVLEIGSGVGFMAVLAAKIVGADNVVTVEANPALLGDIQNNLHINKAENVTVLHYAVVAAPEQSYVGFFVGDEFWSGSISEQEGVAAKPVAVPAIGFDKLLARYPAEVLVCDSEGAEQGYFKNPLPEALHTIVLEIHPKLYSPKEIKAIFDRLSSSGFGYSPLGSNGQVVCFKRVE